MAKLTKEDQTARVERMPGFEGRYTESDGYTIGFERFDADADFKPYFRGLPDDKCQSSHWGYVIRGTLTYHLADRDEVIKAGEAYYVGPGHTPEAAAGTEVVEFSPTEELARTMAVVTRNFESDTT